LLPISLYLLSPFDRLWRDDMSSLCWRPSDNGEALGVCFTSVMSLLMGDYPFCYDEFQDVLIRWLARRLCFR
jgi:hypothetical protein